MKATTALIGLAAALCIALSGCGLKGNLYMPERASAPVSAASGI
ncbi:MAG: hypothetical protein ACFWTZ_06345 [Burkholderia sp.]|jgi:predicted small lipoprotein YifL